MSDYDLLIVGGGLVGASLACALGDRPAGRALRIAVVEATPFTSAAQPSFDARTVALADGSRQIFSSMGLWEKLAKLGVTPIKRIHVSDRKHLGVSHLDSAEEHRDALGYVVETRVLGQVLDAALKSYSNIDLYCPAQVQEMQLLEQHMAVKLHCGENTQTLNSRLVVAADGSNSLLRRQAGVKTIRLDYTQSAIIANVAVDRDHRFTAYERFTDSGPMALLPTRHTDNGERVFALVWTVASSQSEATMALDDVAFLKHLQQAFGYRAGRFIRVGQRHCYPLELLHAHEHVRPRLAFIGNAAHTLHPVAGQGFNLGLRDVATLAEVVLDGVMAGQDPGDLQLLQQYATWRRRDHLQVTAATDSLVRLFSTRFLPLVVARNLGLLALDIMPPLKKRLMRYAMGYAGKLPRLARGLPL